MIFILLPCISLESKKQIHIFIIRIRILITIRINKSYQLAFGVFILTAITNFMNNTTNMYLIMFWTNYMNNTNIMYFI